MALPLIAVGAVLASALVHEKNKKHYKRLDEKRYNTNNSSTPKLVKEPSDTYGVHSTSKEVKPTIGSIVCCEVYNFVDHTGIWIDQNTIIELSNSGLVKAVSAERFLEERSGENMFVACDNRHQPIVIDGTAERAVNSVYTFREYDVINNNCHKFVTYCLTGQEHSISRFASLNKMLCEVANSNIYWDKAKI